MSQLITFLETMPFWYWFVLAGALLLLEVTTGTTYILWPAAAALFVALLAIFPLGGLWQAQILVFAILTIVLTVLVGPKIKPWLHQAREDHQLLNERGARKIGRRVTVDQNFRNGAGQVRLDDTLWRAESENGEDHSAGAKLEISRVEGTKLIVRTGS